MNFRLYEKRAAACGLFIFLSDQFEKLTDYENKVPPKATTQSGVGAELCLRLFFTTFWTSNMPTSEARGPTMGGDSGQQGVDGILYTKPAHRR